MKSSVRRSLVLILSIVCLLLLGGCKKKKEPPKSFPIDSHPVVSFEPFKSEPDLFEEAFSEKGITFNDTDGNATCHGPEGTWFSFSYKEDLMLVCVSDDGSIVRKDTVTMDQPGRVIRLSEDNGTLYAYISLDRYEDLLAIKDGHIESVTHLPTDLEVRAICIDPQVIDQTIYTILNGQLQAIDLQGEVIKQREVEEVTGLAVNKESIFCLSYYFEIGDYGQYKITQMDRESWKVKKTLTIDGAENLEDDLELFPGKTASEVYIISSNGVFRCDMETGELTLILNAIDYDIDATLLDVTDTELLYETSFQKIGEREEFLGLVRSRIDPSAGSKKLLRAGVLWAEQDYYPLIAAYNRNHTEYYCEIVDYREQVIERLIGSSGSSGDAATITEADVKRACLSILTSQDDIDIVILPDFYSRAFSKSGLLLDLKSELDGAGNMVPGIWDASISDGKQYFVTPFYDLKVNSYAGNVYEEKDLMYENVLSNSKVKRITQGNDLVEGVNGKIYQELKKNGNVSEDTLSMFFKLYDFDNQRYFQEDLLVNEIRSGRLLCIPSSIRSFESFISLFSYFDGEYAYAAPWGFDGPAVAADTYLGISSKTKNKEASLDLLKFVLSRDMQYTYAGTEFLGFPVNQDALSDYLSSVMENFTEEERNKIYSEYAYYSDYDEKIAEEELEMIMSDHYRLDRRSISAKPDAPVLPKGIKIAETKEDLMEIRDILYGMIQNAKEYYIKDETIYSILTDEFVAYRSGERSAKECISTMKNRLDLYGAEQMK